MQATQRNEWRAQLNIIVYELVLNDLIVDTHTLMNRLERRARTFRREEREQIVIILNERIHYSVNDERNRIHTDQIILETQNSALNMSECLARSSQAYVFVASEEIVVLLFIDCGCFNFRHEVSLIIYLLRLSSSVQNNYLS